MLAWLRVSAIALGFIASAAAVVPAQDDAPRQMEVVAQVGPWPVISQMIGYRGRVWFANSVTGINHNSADLYSLDPATGEMRYERHLFSQDAGDPLIHDGLLYWPYEDARESLGWGGIEVTDGEAWRYQVVPSATIFHIHTMAEWQGDLLAVSSAWRAGLQLSRDRGLTWSQLYDHNTAAGKVSRMGTFVVTGDQAVAHMRGPGGVVRLVRWTGGTPVNIKGWKQRERFHGLTEHMGLAFLAHKGSNGVRVWVVEGDGARALPAPKENWRVRDLASDGARLWAVARTQEGGEVWSSATGEEWRLEASLVGGKAMTVATAYGAVYVGGTGDDGRGILWGLMPERLADVAAEPAAALPKPQSNTQTADHEVLAARLDTVLADTENFFNHGRGVLRELVYEIALSDPPADLLAARLTRELPDAEVPLMGGSKDVSVHRLGQYILLWGIGLSGKGQVPLHYLDQPWDLPEHRSEKYFHPLLMALWALRQVGQGDAATIGALVARLGREGDPDWLRGDVVGVLSALTGERFGYDTAAWWTWWAAQSN